MDESRRSLIKKAAVGVGIVWTAPVLTTIGSPTHAAGTPAPGTTTTSPTTTSPPGPCACDPTLFCPGVCLCATTVDGQCGCFQSGSDVAACRPPFVDCPPGTFCVLDPDLPVPFGACRAPCAA